jgi:serine/threonine protein kinase
MQEQTFEGRYQLLAELANTRSYVTYRAYDQIYKETVDIQIYGRPSPSLDAKLASYQIDNFNLFLQNAQQLKRLNEQAPSSYFQPVVECNVSNTTNQVYIVFKHIEGTNTLGQVASFFPKTTPGRSDLMANDGLEENIRAVYKHIWLLEQAAVALDYANQKGVAHNNISMNAIIVQEASSGSGTVWLTDFDLSSSAPGLNSRLGQAWSPYVSPEQRNGYALERTSDIYSFAAVVYEMVFGLTPNAPMIELPGGERESVVTELVQLFPKANGNLAYVFGKALRYDPQKRYQTALEFVGELKKALEVWLRDWANFRTAANARWHGGYDQMRDAAVGLYTLDRLNREAWNSAALQEELNLKVAGTTPPRPFLAITDEMLAPPPGVVVAGLNDYPETEYGGDVFEYRNDDNTRVTALERVVPNVAMTIPQANPHIIKFRPNLAPAPAREASNLAKNALLIIVPLAVLVLAGLIIALFIGGESTPTPTALATTKTALNVNLFGTTAPLQPSARPLPTSTFAVVQSPTPTGFQINLTLGLGFLQQGNFGAAKEVLQKALAEQPNNKEVLRALNYADGGISLADGDFPKAITALEAVFKENPNFLQVQPNLQTALLGLGDNLRVENPEEARKAYRQAANLQGSRKDEANQKATELGG